MSIKSFLITLVLGVIISFFIFKGCSKHSAVPPVITAPAKLVKIVTISENNTAVKVDSLQLLLKDVDKHVAWLNLNQNAADRTIASLREKIAGMAKKPPAENNYEAGKEDLFFEIENLNAANDQRDSLCDATVFTLQKSGIIKDSIIELKNNLYANLRRSFDTAIDNNYKLIEFTKVQKKEIRNCKVGALFWKVAAIGAGVFIVKQSL